jgi:hypothetical protein
MVNPLENHMCNDCTDNPNKELRGVNACPQCRELHVNYAKAMDKPSLFTEINVDVSYYASTSTLIELPAYKTWDDVEDCFVKWNTFNIKWKGTNEYIQFPLSEEANMGDMKIPLNFTVNILEP